jgi:hypothetical protein
MSTTQADTVVSLTIGQLEVLIRRVVREELAHYQPRPLSAVDDWSHEGPDDPEGDEILARDALAQIEKIKKDPSRVRPWEEFEAELLAAEARGELPD